MAKKKTTRQAAVKKSSPAKAKDKKETPLKVSSALKRFALPGTGGEFRFSDYLGKRLVLFFYPKDATPGCTLEARDFNRLLPEFKKLGVVVVGISRDSLSSHERYRGKEKLNFDLLSDSDEKACRLFDVIREKNMYGRKVMGIERSTFVFDEKGRLSKEWRKVSVPGHADEVLQFLKGEEKA